MGKIEKQAAFRFLGGFSVTINGEVVHIASAQARALLAFLLLEPSVKHSREKLAGILWPDSSTGNARTYLRQALWQLSSILGKDFFSTDKHSLGVSPQAAYDLDLDRLRASSKKDVSIDLLNSRLSVYAGELLPGMYEDWVLRARDELQFLFESQMAVLIRKLENAQRWGEVLEWGEHWIARSQAPEEAYRALMRARAAMGDKASVAAVYLRCVRDLQAQLAVAPSEETQDLFSRLTKKPSVASPAIQAETYLPEVAASYPQKPRLVRLLNVAIPIFIFLVLAGLGLSGRLSKKQSPASGEFVLVGDAYELSAPILRNSFSLSDQIGRSDGWGQFDITDFDQDGHWDLVTGSGEYLIVFLDFSTKDRKEISLPTRFQINSVAIGDLDNDGDDDIMAGSASGPNMVWVNDGMANFTEWETIAGPSSWDIALGDVDGDGDLDLVDAITGANIVWLNDGHGKFGFGYALSVASDSVGVALADLDLDEDLDLVVANITGESEVWLNDGQGEFASHYELPFRMAEDLAVADVNQDGFLDLLLAARDAPIEEGRTVVSPVANGVFLSESGAFIHKGQQIGSGYSISIAVGDVDNDGDMDVYVGNGEDPVGPQRDELWLNDGKGNFSLAYIEDEPQFMSMDVGFFDVNADGLLDVIIQTFDQGLAILLNSGEF